MTIEQLIILLNANLVSIYWGRTLKATRCLEQLRDKKFIAGNENSGWQLTKTGKSFSALILKYANDNL